MSIVVICRHRLDEGEVGNVGVVADKPQEPYVVTIAGEDYRLGRGRLIALESAKLAPEHDAWRASGIPNGATIGVVPGASNVVLAAAMSRA